MTSLLFTIPTCNPWLGFTGYVSTRTLSSFPTGHVSGVERFLQPQLVGIWIKPEMVERLGIRISLKGSDHGNRTEIHPDNIFFKIHSDCFNWSFCSSRNLHFDLEKWLPLAATDLWGIFRKHHRVNAQPGEILLAFCLLRQNTILLQFIQALSCQTKGLNHPSHPDDLNANYKGSSKNPHMIDWFHICEH